MPEPRVPLSDDTLAAAYRSARTPSGDHLSDQQWEQLACDELHGADRERALAHIESCGECTLIHRGLLDLRAQAANLETSRTSGAPQPRRHWSTAAGLAAAAALVAAVLINQPGRTALGSADATRSGDAREAITVVTPSPNAAISGRRFEWRPVTGAAAYELRVYSAEGAPVFSTRTTATFAELPAGVPLNAGSYFWQVAAFKDEASIGASPMIPFRAH